MVSKPTVYIFVWKDEFVLLDEKEKPTPNDIVLYIDEESRYMRLTYPSSTKNIIRTKLHSKLLFIQKRGIWLERLNQRIGKDYEFHIDSGSSQNEELPSPLATDASNQETQINQQIKTAIKIIKQIWIHRRTFEGTDSMNQEQYGQPEKYVQFRASDFEKLDIQIRNLPDSIASN
ncbi:MAG: hypothetical protein ACFFFH_00295 [Candidatus Thorarchaeota archaeon]